MLSTATKVICVLALFVALAVAAPVESDLDDTARFLQLQQAISQLTSSMLDVSGHTGAGSSLLDNDDFGLN